MSVTAGAGYTPGFKKRLISFYRVLTRRFLFCTHDRHFCTAHPSPDHGVCSGTLLAAAPSATSPASSSSSTAPPGPSSAITGRCFEFFERCPGFEPLVGPCPLQFTFSLSAQAGSGLSHLSPAPTGLFLSYPYEKLLINYGRRSLKPCHLDLSQRAAGRSPASAPGSPVCHQPNHVLLPSRVP